MVPEERVGNYLRYEKNIHWEALDSVLKNYSFYNGKIEHIHDLPKKFNNINCYIKIEGQAWVVKQYQKIQVTEKLNLSHQVQSILFNEGFPCAKLEHSKTGLPLVDVDGFIYSVHRWIDGIQLSPFNNNDISNGAVNNVAMALGSFHAMVKQKINIPVLTDSMHLSASSLVGRAHGKAESIILRNKFRFSSLDKIRLKIKKNNFDRWIIKRFPFLLETAEQIKISCQQKTSLFNEAGVTHNDINWENLIFNENQELLAILDFDNLIIAPVMYEVGAAAIIIAGPDKDKISHFLDSYTKTSGVDCNIEAVNISMAIKCLCSMLYSIHMYAQGQVDNLVFLGDWCTYLYKCLEFIIEEQL